MNKFKNGDIVKIISNDYPNGLDFTGAIGILEIYKDRYTIKLLRKKYNLKRGETVVILESELEKYELQCPEYLINE